MLGCSRWWVCEQCRRGRFPFVKAGGAYRFTDQHVQDIVALLEEVPAGRRRNASLAARESADITPRVPGTTTRVQLQARQPRRAQIPSAAATTA